MDIKQFLDIVQNKDTYSEYLKALESREAKIKESIELAGKSGDISKLHDKAIKLVSDAEEQAAKIRANAASVANGMVEDAKQRLAEAQSMADKSLSDIAAVRAERKALDERAAVLTAKEKELQKSIDRAFEYEKSLSKKDLELSEKLAKINSVLG